jgi:Zn finger protein HypA/HybF involved in hydrogenase expression
MSHTRLKPMPSSGTLCWCKQCGELFQAWPNLSFCEKHRKPRVRLVDGKYVTVNQESI